jgi:hypothetical protein
METRTPSSDRVEKGTERMFDTGPMTACIWPEMLVRLG